MTLLCAGCAYEYDMLSYLLQETDFKVVTALVVVYSRPFIAYHPLPLSPSGIPLTTKNI